MSKDQSQAVASAINAWIEREAIDRRVAAKRLGFTMKRLSDPLRGYATANEAEVTRTLERIAASQDHAPV